MYARTRTYENISVYSNNICPLAFNKVLEKATSLITQSELYDSTFHFDVFLNDGSSFPFFPKKIFGDAFAWGYYNNVVLNGVNDSSFTFMKLNGYNRQLARTIAHEMMHCLEAKRFGLTGSRPLKNIPNWKWEGYPEFIAYRSSLYKEDSLLIANLALLDSLKDQPLYVAMVNTDEGMSVAGMDYFRWWLMIKYCMDVKKMTFIQIMKDEVKYDDVYREMMEWHRSVHHDGATR
jgi:hypothetical protein